MIKNILLLWKQEIAFLAKRLLKMLLFSYLKWHGHYHYVIDIWMTGSEVKYKPQNFTLSSMLITFFFVIFTWDLLTEVKYRN